MAKKIKTQSQLYYIILIIFFILIFGYTSINIFDFGPTGEAVFEITAACSNDNTLFRLANLTGGHAGTWDGTSYTNKVCYTDSSGHSCTGTNTVIRLSNVDNAHAEEKGLANPKYSDVCFGDLTCTYINASCPASYSCIASISGSTNAHVGNCSAYSEKICCKRSNHAPVISAASAKVVYEDSMSTMNLTSNISDIDNDPLTLTANSTHIKVNGRILEFNYTLPIDDSVNITVSDSLLNSSAIINITVLPVNDPPVLAPIGSLTAIAGQLFTRILNATDEDNATLIFSANTTLFSMVKGIINFTPTYLQNGTYSLNFSVSDGQLTDYEIVSFSIVDTNHPPVIVNFTPLNTTINTTKGTMLFFNFSASDPDGTIPSQRWLKDDTILLSTEQPLWHNATAGTHTITLIITDGIVEVSKVWTISAPIINNPPLLALPIPDQTITGNRTNAINLNNHFADPDGDALIFSATSSPNVNIVIVNGVVSFYPTAVSTITERIIFTASDNIESTPSNEIAVNIVPQAIVTPARCGNNILDSGEECDGTKNQACKGLNCKSDCTCAKQVTSCTPNWQCGSWSACAAGKQARTCKDLNTCNNLAGKPSEQQSCAAAEQPKKEQPMKIEEEQPWRQGWLLYAIIAIVVLGAGGGGFVLYTRKKKKMYIERQKIMQIEEAARRTEAQHEAALRQYILNTLNKGFSQEQISRKLIESGWNSSVVGKIMKSAIPAKQPQQLIKMRLAEPLKEENEKQKIFAEFEEKKEAEEEIKPLPLKEEKSETKEKEETFKKLGELTREHSPFERLVKLKTQK